MNGSRFAFIHFSIISGETFAQAPLFCSFASNSTSTAFLFHEWTFLDVRANDSYSR